MSKICQILRKTTYTLNGRKGSKAQGKQTSRFMKRNSYGGKIGLLSFKKTQPTAALRLPEKRFLWNIGGNFSGGDPGETEWHYTGLEDQGEPLPMYGKGFTLGVSGNVVYAGKRDGHLFQSLDNGNTWSDITENLAFPFTYFKEIIVVGSTVYISTDAGVMNSYDDTIWYAVNDIDGHILAMNRIATDGSRLYGVCDTGVYQVNNHTNTWRQMTSEVPSTTVTSLAATGGTLYIGTEDNGVFRLQHIEPEFRVSNLP